MLKILVVDDENLVRVALRSIIDWEQHGFDFIGTASDGYEAIAMVEKFHPDIVITDLKMPNMDGLQLIKKLKESNYAGKIVVLSNYGELDLVKQALMLGAAEYILKVTIIADDFIAMLNNIGGALASEKEMKIRKLIETIQLKQSITIMKNDFFKYLLNDENDFEYQYIARQIEEAGLPAVLPKSIMLYVFIDNYEEALGSAEFDDRKMLSTSMQKIISEYLSPINDIQIVGIDHKRLAVIIPLQGFKLIKNTPEKSAKKIHDLLKLYLNIEVSIVVSTEFEGYYGAKSMYSKCIKAIGFKFYSGNGSIIAIFPQVTDNKLFSEYENELRKIWPLFEEKNISEAAESIKTIVSYASKACIEPILLKKDVIRLVEIIERKIYNSSLMKGHIFESNKEHISNAETADQFIELVSELLKSIFALLKTEYKANYRDEIRSIIQFINNNYSKKITINMISKYANLNESYICRLFKNETGKSIMSYINEVRMDKAAALIKGKDMPIKNIACQVGIDDQFYFNKVFRKYFGVSPTDFRNSKKSSSINCH
ncbi:MAG: response regulator [Clostridiaceae bacterium]